MTCDVVLAELALGSGIPPEAEKHLGRLPSIPTPSASHTRSFLDRHLGAFRATGVGWADAQIIVAAVDAGALLYSLDGPQRAVWRSLGFRTV